MSKPGSVPGPIRVKPNKRSDLTDFRRAKRLQDHINWMVEKEPASSNPWRWLLGLNGKKHSDR